jgi:polyisoprenoid-binding protein YceI
MKQPGLAPDRSMLDDQVVSSWAINHRNSWVRFSVEQFNLVSGPFRSVTGEFQVYAGAIQAVSEDFNEAKINFSVIAGSIYTGNHKRDKHLRSAAFFDAEHFPVIKFMSVAFIKGPRDGYILEGHLTMRGVCGKIAFDVAQGRSNLEANVETATFKIRGKLNRLDFGIKGTPLSEIFISKEVTITLQLEFLKQQI